MRKYSDQLTQTFPYNVRIADSVFIRENAGDQKPVLPHIIRCETYL